MNINRIVIKVLSSFIKLFPIILRKYYGITLKLRFFHYRLILNLLQLATSSVHEFDLP